MTAGGIDCVGRRKVPTMSQLLLQHSKFTSKRVQVRKWRTCFLPRAPSNLVTPLVRGQCPHHAPTLWRPWKIYGVTLRNKMRSCEIRKALNVELLFRIERSQLRRLGHLSRIPRERFASQVLLATPTRKQQRGHPRARWKEYISDLAWSRLLVEPEKNTRDCCWPWGISRPAAYLGYGRHGTCHGHHFDAGAKIAWQK